MNWMKAAREISDLEPGIGGRHTIPFEKRIAAVIARHADPLLALLAESRRKHDRDYHEESCDYPPCPKSEEDAAVNAKCICSADAWNAKIDEVLK